MQRRPRPTARTPDYPVRSRCVDRRSVLRGLGLAATAVVTAGGTRLLAGCVDEGQLGQERQWVILIPEDGSRRLEFDMGQHVDYHVTVTIGDREVATFVQDERDRVGAALDPVLRSHGFYGLEPPADLDSLEDDALSCLADEFLEEMGHVDLTHFRSARITIDDWVDDWWAGGEGDDDTGDDDADSGDDDTS